ncbi:MAG: molybdopterin molybdotransferase MoeA [Spirochaetia bacterium]
MITFPQALSIVESQNYHLESETVELSQAVGRYLLGPLESEIDHPPFSKAAMDGFAVVRGDDSSELRVLETIAAGQIPRYRVGVGTCSRIMTGAMLPEGADMVHRVEYAEERDGYMVRTQQEPGRNVIERGENLKAGEKTLSPRVLEPQDIGVAASLGVAALTVMRRPRVGVIATGDELAEPGHELPAGGIYNSNAYQLAAHARRNGCVPRYYGVAEDSPAALSEVLARAFAAEDIIILTGGVSKGEFDYVPEVLEQRGVEILFHRVAMKPGRPTLFGRRGRETARAGAGEAGDDAGAGEAENAAGTNAGAGMQYVFGLPGNPVSAFVTFEVFARPLLHRLAGMRLEPRMSTGILARSVQKKDSERAEFVPVRWRGGQVEPVSYHGSSHLSALGEADGLLQLDVGNTGFDEGAWVHVRQIRP